MAAAILGECHHIANVVLVFHAVIDHQVAVADSGVHVLPFHHGHAEDQSEEHPAQDRQHRQLDEKSDDVLHGLLFPPRLGFFC